jgi:predicted molibdopterin-dependent oxidoreductase YjgC
MPWHYPGYMEVDDSANAQKWEEAWNIEPGGLNQNLGLTTTEILSQVKPGGVRSLYIVGENPMMSEPNLNHTRQQMEALEFLVAQDLFITESGAFADIFLPATSWAEKEGTFTNTDRRVSVCARLSLHAANLALTGRSSAILPSESKPGWAAQTRLIGIT